MLSCARTRHLAACTSTSLLAGVVMAGAAPAVAGAMVRPPGVPARADVAPSASAPTASRCHGGGARHASPAVLRRAMLCLVNRARMSAGLSPFRAERHLARAASRHAADMGRRHYFAHVSPSGESARSRARAAGWRGGVGEVIAWGCGVLSTPRATVRAWLDSPPHRSIILGSARAAGVGVKRLAGCGGRAYWVMDVG
jgi:uncharacterized protein YkwD